MKDRRSYDDREIARYVLGLYDETQSNNIQQCLARDNAAAARALKWEAYFLGIVDALPQSVPPPALLAQIEETLGMAPLARDVRDTPAPAQRPDRAAGASSDPAAPVVAERRAHDDQAEKRGVPALWKRRWPWLAAGVLILCLAGILFWAGTRETPSSPTQQILNLPPK